MSARLGVSLLFGVLLGACHAERAQNGPAVATRFPDGVLAARPALCALVAAQKSMTEPRAMSSDYNPLLWHGDDARFVVDTVKMSRSEVELSKVAVAKSADTAVQNLALVLIRDEGKIHHTLTSWSRTYGFALPKNEDSKVAAVEDRLKELNGADFERAYLELMAKDNAADVSRFQTEIGAAVDRDLAKLAAKYLPKLQADGQLLPSKKGK
jgi:putative membrane protein